MSKMLFIKEFLAKAKE